MNIFRRQGRALLLTALIALLAAMPALAAVKKYIAVVNTDVDAAAASRVSATMDAAEIRQITAELRRVAVDNLPRDKYQIMTAETVQSMGGDVLAECSEENCVITLGSKIGADYIVRGTISMFGTKLTLLAEMYETKNGTLVASSSPVRSENKVELLDMVTVACAGMYKKFLSDQQVIAPQTPTPPLPPPPQTYTLEANASPPDGGYVSRYPNKETYTAGETVTVTATAYDGYTFTGWSGAATGRLNRLTLTMDGDKTATANFYKKSVPPPPPPPPTPQYTTETTTVQPPPTVRYTEETRAEPTRRTENGFTLGYAFAGGANIFQAGFAQGRPIGDGGASFVWEANILVGGVDGSDHDYTAFGVDIPLLLQYDVSVLSFETGVQADILDVFGGDKDGSVLNAGAVVGMGIRLGGARLFYRFNAGTGYYSQMIEVRMMF